MILGMEWSGDALPSSLLVLAPHPDDDVLGCSLLMRRVAARDGRIVATWLTDGGASHGPLAPEPRRRLVESRQTEALAALSELGVIPEAACFLGYPDGTLDERCEEAGLRLQRLCDHHEIDTVVVTDGEDDHLDHRAAFKIATGLKVARLYSYPISTRYDGELYRPPDGAIFIPCEHSDHKRAALSRHRSQTRSGGATYPLSAATIDRFCAEAEVFIPIRRRA
jgi:LmbE family N-acetylglucosaminyl deacetylase